MKSWETRSIHNIKSQYMCWLCLKLHLCYFEKSPLIVFNELFIHHLELCLCVHEIGIQWIWTHFTMLLESFVIYKSFVDMVFLRILKFECAFYYSNIHQMFSNFLWALIYLKRRATCVYIFKCIYVLDPWMDVVNFDLNIFNGKKGSKFVIMVKNKSVHLTII
jgi:hypothetical protein